MAKTVHVRAKGADHKVVLWERHPDHPNGEVFLSNDGKVREVALTDAVKKLMAEGVLVEEAEKPKTKGPNKANVPPLRPATDAEEDAAGLVGSVEKETARVPVHPTLDEMAPVIPDKE